MLICVDKNEKTTITIGNSGVKSAFLTKEGIMDFI